MDPRNEAYTLAGPAPLDTFVALDVETASRSPIRVCAVGAVRIEARQETKSFRSLVKVDGRVRFREIHGLTAADLADAPLWPVVWRGLVDLIGDLRTIVAFRASFDRAAILTMCGRSGSRLPRVTFVCAADMFERRHGRGVTLSEAIVSCGLTFPGRPHDPLADARAAAMIALACGEPD